MLHAVRKGPTEARAPQDPMISGMAGRIPLQT